MKTKPKVLIVDDDASFVDFLLDALKNENFYLEQVNSADEALTILSKGKFNLVITDVILPGVDGLKFLENIRTTHPTLDVIFCTGYSEVNSAVKALKLGAYDYLTKPVDAEEVRLTIHRCLEQRNIYEENTELKKMVQLIDSCKSISTTFDREKICEHSLDVLMKEVDASLGFFLVTEEDDNDIEVVNYKGVKETTKEKLANIFARFTSSWAKKEELIFHLKKDEATQIKKLYRSFKDGIVLKISADGVVKAFIVLINNNKQGNFTPTRLRYATFIAKETVLAFENLGHYLGAKELAYIDDFTNLYNYRYLHLILDREIKRAKRFKTTLLLLFIDLDKFKSINDAHGHLAGGKVLIEMADVLTECLREIDTIVRYGGDEYVIVLTETDISTGMMVAERIRKGIEEHDFLKEEGLSIHLSACIGVAAYPNHAKNKKELIHLADMAMYMGKETTRNVVFSAANRKIKNKER